MRCQGYETYFTHVSGEFRINHPPPPSADFAKTKGDDLGVTQITYRKKKRKMFFRFAEKKGVIWTKLP